MHPYKIYLPYHQQALPARILALVLSYVYGWLVYFRNLFYDKGWLPSQRLPGSCIAVGNLTVGGTGKSPFVMDLAKQLHAKGFRPAILTRGYGSSLGKRDVLVLLGGGVLAQNFEKALLRRPDEAMMQSQRNPTVPVIVGRNRSKAAQWFLKHASLIPTHWILDDGFQHRKIQRDLDIVLLDGHSPFGNGFLLPLGSLREPLASLNRADWVCFTRASQDWPSAEAQELVRRFSSAATAKLGFNISIRPQISGVDFRKEYEPVLLMCGIAQPDRLLAQVRQENIQVGASYFVQDHLPFSPDEMQRQMASCRSILTTEKDFWRNPSLFTNSDKPYFIIDLTLSALDGEEITIFEKILHSPRMF